MDAYEQAGKMELKEKEQKEKEILTEYLKDV
jgi:uncharacterized protein YqeY